MPFYILAVLQCIGIVLVLFEVVYLVMQRPSQMTSLFLTFTICTLVNSIGYLLEMFSSNQGEALMAVRFAYVGKVYIVLLMFLFVTQYCGIRLPKALFSALFLFHTLIALLVLTSSHQKLYYTSIRFSDSGMFPHLVMSHGVFYILYSILCIIYMVIMPAICFVRYRHVVNKTEKKLLISLIVVVAIPFTGYILLLLNLTGGYDSTAVSYLISSSILFYSFFKSQFFDTVELARDSVVDNLDNGIVVLDNGNKLLYANSTAKEIFPELSQSSTREIIDYLFGLVYSKQHFIKNSQIYSTRIQVVYSKYRVRGKLIVLNDITDSYNYTRNLESAVSEKTEELKYIQSSLIESLATMIEARDGITGQHVKRTSAYVKIITLSLQQNKLFQNELNDHHVMNIIQAAPLHDIGKISIPDTILQKPARLTPEEFEIIKTHTSIGATMIDEILQKVEHYDYLSVAKDVAHYHHEKWDGSGYPCGLKGSSIPLAARIMAVADVFDALLSERPYKNGFSFEKSVEIIRNESGTHFDPVVVDAFLDAIDEIKAVG